VLELADTASAQRGDEYIGTEHLLLGMLEEKKNIGAQILVHLGVTADRVSQLLMEVHSGRALPLPESDQRL
jgi:ATP-dependent Clp protease ATP-binding subunit ClpC